CRGPIPPPRGTPAREKGQKRRRDSRAACRTICSSSRRQAAVDRARTGSRRAPGEVDPKAETVAFESERFVESVRAVAPSIRGQHQLVAALIATESERELHHGFADA